MFKFPHSTHLLNCYDNDVTDPKDRLITQEAAYVKECYSFEERSVSILRTIKHYLFHGGQ